MQNEVPGCKAFRLHIDKLKAVSSLFLLLFLLVCKGPAHGTGWGQNATLTPGWERLGTAVKSALFAPETWAPAAGALVLQIDRADRRVQAWAARHTPIFGSQDRADQMSDNLKNASGALWVVSALAAPSTDEEGEWLGNKTKGLGVQFGAGILLRSTVGVLKETTKRERPNNLGETSFPSAHASNVSLYSTLTSRNVDTFGWSDDAVAVSRFGLGTVAAATAWARVEANQHYPSDVLAGIALGHFVGAFFTEAFLGIDNPSQARVMFEPLRDGYQMVVSLGL